MNVPGLWISAEYDTKLPRATKNVDFYWYDMPIGSLTMCYENAGWSDWKWCSGSRIGDQMKVKDNNNLYQIRNEAHAQIEKVIVG